MVNFGARRGEGQGIPRLVANFTLEEQEWRSARGMLWASLREVALCVLSSC